MIYNDIWKNISNSDNSNDFLILTPNNRLSQFLHKDYSQYVKLNFKKKAWHGLSIFPIKEFIKLIWQESADLDLISNSFYLISDFQKQILFEKILDNHFLENLNLLNKKISNKIISAYNLLKDYQINLSLLNQFNYPEINSLKAIIKFYNEHNFENIIFKDQYDFINLLMKLKEREINLIIKPKKIILIGFDELSPLSKSFFNFLKDNNYQVTIIDSLNLSKNNIKNYKFTDRISELEGVIEHSHNFIYKENKNLTIIVPNLVTVRKDIIKRFSAKFKNRQDWNISGGDFLSETPIINSLIILLDFLFTKKTSIETAQEILRRPFYVNENSELIGKYKVISILRQNNFSNEINLFDFFKYTLELAPSFNKALSSALDSIDSIKHNNLKLLPSEFSKKFIDFANLIGWPGTIREISSEEYQAIQVFKESLYELNKLDVILNKLTITDYFEILKKYLNNVEFQIEVNEPKVNVLGILEGAGIEFDNLWFMSLTADLWPEEPNPNVFLPKELQRQYNMPHSSFDREFDFATKITNRIFANSSNVITSYYEFENQKQVYPSIFVDSLESEKFQSKNNKLEINTQYDHFEKYEDYIGPKINRKFIKSAIYALNLQLQCPFRAFAETRLNAKKFQEIKFGITPIDRGNLLHSVMEKIWLKLKSKSGLLSFLDQPIKDIKNFIMNIIDVSFEKLHLEKSLYQDLCNIEKKRLFKIIFKWLKKESLRNTFEVKYTELEQNVKFENIYFTLRIDRIDYQYNNGIKNKVIIDYKISSQNTTTWLNNVSDIQMPMYYLMFTDSQKHSNCDGLLYSVINSKEQKFQGFISNEVDFGINIKKIDFNSYKDSWYSQIKMLANQYLGGVAIKAPVNLDVTCKNCHLKSLCRLYE